MYQKLLMEKLEAQKKNISDNTPRIGVCKMFNLLTSSDFNIGYPLILLSLLVFRSEVLGARVLQ